MDLSRTPIDSKYIPLDKSWIIRMGILDIVNRSENTGKFLATQEGLGGDLLALKRAVEAWPSDSPVDVGESGTLYRLLQFASWKLGLDKTFITHGTLAARNIYKDPSVVNLPQEDLLRLDSGTSQWATAAVLLGDQERLPKPPFKLALTYEAVEHWKTQRGNGVPWEPRYDNTILHQAEAYLAVLKGKKVGFVPRQAEDFCFAYFFGYVTAEEAENKWPSLRGHESDRITEVRRTLNQVREEAAVDSKDHRVIQAIAMWAKTKRQSISILYPAVVNKSWPQFWDFLNWSDSLV